MTRLLIRQAGDAIRRREAFVAGGGSMSAGFATAGNVSELGLLPDAQRADFANAVTKHRRELYVVWSYRTPIAWGGPGEPLTVPAVRYSTTTSKHQYITRRAEGV
jgi:hypothetical protein